MGWRNPGPLVTTLGALSVLFWLGVTLEAVGRAGCRGAAVVAGNVMQAGLGVFISVLPV